MKTKKLLAFLLTLLLTAGLFAGCSAADSAAMDNGEYYSAATMAANDMAVAETSAALSDSSQTGSTTLPEDRKLITTFHIEAETEDLDAMLAHINTKITELGGYMESREVHNGSSYSSYRYRNASLTIRIPADKVNLFVDTVSENANIVSSYDTSDDVTLSYVSIESRITALETEEARLLELLAMAENMEDLLLIESRLTEVRTELEQVTSQLRVMDNQINYSTIHLNLDEVKEYTEVEEPETVGERISSGFTESMENLWEGLTELFIFVVTRLPYLIPAAIVAAIVILIVKLSHRKKNKKEPPQPPENNTQ